MTPVYVDTGAFIALVWSRDRAHRAVRRVFHEVRAAGHRLVTSDPVIGETVTRLRYDAGLAVTRQFAEIIQDATRTGQLVVRESDARLRRAAFDVMARYEGLRLSYADAVGAVVTREIDASAVLTLDTDFRVMGFHVLPEEPSS